jgi:hypothetical protein
MDLMLHGEIYTTEFKLLEEANRILSEPPKYDVERYERLQKLHGLGFTNAEEVKEFKLIDDELKSQRILKETIEMYRQQYPLNKFITKEAVKSICLKYGLFLTEVKDYTAEIPVKNQNEIIGFRVVRGDTRFPREIHNSRMYVGDTEYGWDWIRTRSEYNKNYQKEIISGRDLLILAPLNKFNMKDKKIEGHVIKSVLKDPIVLQSVKCKYDSGDHDGYLIVTSWGLEAQDEQVFNPINN